MTDHRTAAIARIRALRARAADTASSEAEAEAAARIAAKIINKHGVTEAELVERGVAGICEGEHNAGRSRQHPALDAACYAIGSLTECKALIRYGANLWVGQPEDVEFALYLSELIQGASERAYRIHWQRMFRRAPPAMYRRSFLLGFGAGISDRMLRMVAEREQSRRNASTTGTSLTVVKGALIDDYMAKTQPHVRNRRRRSLKTDPMAMLHGHRASGALSLSRPIDVDENDKGALASSGGDH